MMFDAQSSSCSSLSPRARGATAPSPRKHATDEEVSASREPVQGDGEGHDVGGGWSSGSGPTLEQCLVLPGGLSLTLPAFASSKDGPEKDQPDEDDVGKMGVDDDADDEDICDGYVEVDGEGGEGAVASAGETSRAPSAMTAATVDEKREAAAAIAAAAVIAQGSGDRNERAIISSYTFSPGEVREHLAGIHVHVE